MSDKAEISNIQVVASEPQKFLADEVSQIRYPELRADLRGAVELVQIQLKEGIDGLDRRTAELASIESRRRWIATCLKVVSVVSSLVIATGFADGVPSQVLGGLITATAALERVFANMSRLLAVAAAKSALDRVRRQVVSIHNQNIIEVLKNRNKDPEKSAEMLINFVGKLRDSLAKVRDEVETKLEANAYELLGRLTLDEPSRPM